MSRTVYIKAQTDHENGVQAVVSFRVRPGEIINNAYDPHFLAVRVLASEIVEVPETPVEQLNVETLARLLADATRTIDKLSETNEKLQAVNRDLLEKTGTLEVKLRDKTRLERGIRYAKGHIEQAFDRLDAIDPVGF